MVTPSPMQTEPETFEALGDYDTADEIRLERSRRAGDEERNRQQDEREFRAKQRAQRLAANNRRKNKQQ